MSVGLSRHRYDEATFESALRQFQRMQNRMVELVSEASENGTPIAASLTNSLNAVTSSHAACLAAKRDRLPTTIVTLLLLPAVVAAMLVGREQGASGKADIACTICFIELASFVILVTLDPNQPDRGLITVSQEPMREELKTQPVKLPKRQKTRGYVEPKHRRYNYVPEVY